MLRSRALPISRPLRVNIADHRAREAALVQIGKELNGFSDASEILQRVIDVAAEALKFEDCSLFLIDVVTDKLVLRASRGPLAKQIGQASYDLGEGLTGWTAANGQAGASGRPDAATRGGRACSRSCRRARSAAFMAVPISIHGA